jgi:hypothetical protein
MASLHTTTGGEKKDGRGKTIIGWEIPGNTQGVALVAFGTELFVSG